MALGIPGEAEALALIDGAEWREADLARRIQDSEAERRRAVEMRSDVAARIAAGEDVPEALASGATAAVGAAEQRTALLQEALREAEAATKRARGELVQVYRAELRRRSPIAHAAAAAAVQAFERARAERNRLEVLAMELQRGSSTLARPVSELHALLERSTEFAPAMARV